MSKKVYCGVEELQKNQRRGTAKECAELKQIRYYGLKKVSKDVADEYKGIPVESKLKEKRLLKNMGTIRGKLEAYKAEIKDYKYEDSYNKNKKYQKEVKELEEKLDKEKEKLKKILEKIKEFKKKKSKN
jgi:chromosome segregation ATPase